MMMIWRAVDSVAMATVTVSSPPHTHTHTHTCNRGRSRVYLSRPGVSDLRTAADQRRAHPPLPAAAVPAGHAQDRERGGGAMVTWSHLYVSWYTRDVVGM